jgi:hypothetical protein
MIKTERPQDFQKRVLGLNISNNPRKEGTPLNVLLGFSRSNTAKSVAEILKKTQYVGISVGAAAPLGEINPRFYSVAYSLNDQWTKTKSLFKNLHCNKVFGFFPLTNGYSNSLKKHFVEDNIGIEVKDINILSNVSDRESCIYIGANFGDSQKVFRHLIDQQKELLIIGPADWALSGNEIRKAITNSKVKIFAPSGWPQNGYSISPLGRRLKEKAARSKIYDPSPILGYSFDAAVLAVYMICSRRNLNTIIKHGSAKTNLIRTYSGVSQSGNLIGTFFVHDLHSIQNKTVGN